MAEQVTSTADVVTLASRIMGPRERPLVVVSTHPGTGDFVLDVDELRGEIDGLAELHLIATGDLTRTLDEHLPERTQVYGGAGRSYPVDFGADPDWRRSPLRFPGRNATSALIGDVLTQANAAGVFAQKPASRRVRAGGVVRGFVGPARAIVDTERHGMVFVAGELTYPPVPLEWMLRAGQHVEGDLDLDTKRLLVALPAPDLAALADAFPHRCVTPVLVKKVNAGRALLQLHPAHDVLVRREDVSANPLDTVDLLLAAGDVVAARVLHLSDGALHLALHDVDDDEPVVPALPLTSGGPPWLEVDRGLPRDDAADEAVERAAVEEGLQAAAQAMDAGESAAGAPTESAVVESPHPGPGLRRAVVPPPDQDDAPDLSMPAMSSATALQSTQLQLAAGQARIRALEEQLRAAGADDSALRKLQARVSGAEARVREELAERGELERRLRDLESQRRAGTQALRAARKLTTVAPVSDFDAEARRARWLSDDEWVRHEIYLAWVDRVAPGERDAWPIGKFDVGSEFAASVMPLGEVAFGKAIRAAVDVVTGRVREVRAREAHPLRTGDGAEDADTIRAADGAKCWRAYIEQRTPAARRIHYWMLPGGGVELSRIVSHDDVQP